MAAGGKIRTLTPWMFRRCEQAKDKILEATVDLTRLTLPDRLRRLSSVRWEFESRRQMDSSVPKL